MAAHWQAGHWVARHWTAQHFSGNAVMAAGAGPSDVLIGSGKTADLRAAPTLPVVLQGSLKETDLKG